MFVKKQLLFHVKAVVFFDIGIQPFEYQCFLRRIFIAVQWHLIPINDWRVNTILFNEKVLYRPDILEIRVNSCNLVFFLDRKTFIWFPQ